MLSAAMHLDAHPERPFAAAQGDMVDGNGGTWTMGLGGTTAGSSRGDNWRHQQVKQYYVYIMTNRSQTLYTGVTNNLRRRMFEHKLHLVTGFTSKYHITRLVYFEETSDVHAAIAREKQIKGWLRAKKIILIESMNPDWRDLSEEWQ
jgi:putative endonuclease